MPSRKYIHIKSIVPNHFWLWHYYVTKRSPPSILPIWPVVLNREILFQFTRKIKGRNASFATSFMLTGTLPPSGKTSCVWSFFLEQNVIMDIWQNSSSIVVLVHGFRCWSNSKLSYAWNTSNLIEQLNPSNALFVMYV